jgi:hypothetical protein
MGSRAVLGEGHRVGFSNISAKSETVDTRGGFAKTLRGAAARPIRLLLRVEETRKGEPYATSHSPTGA